MILHWNFKIKEIHRCQRKRSMGPLHQYNRSNLDKPRSKKIIFEYVDAIDKSDSIYVYRWGDLPLWGEVFHYFLDPNDVKLDKNLVYFHGSHNQKNY